MFPVLLPVEYRLFLLVVIPSLRVEFLLVWLLLTAEPEFLKLLAVEIVDLELLMLAPFLELPLLNAVYVFRLVVAFLLPPMVIASILRLPVAPALEFPAILLFASLVIGLLRSL